MWRVIQNGDFYFEVEDEETKLIKETPYELLKDIEKKQLGKNEEAKMTIYNALPRKEYKRVFMCKTAKEVWHTLINTHQGNSQVKNCKIDLLTQEYEKFSISNEETIDSAKMKTIEEAKDLATLPLDELIGNLTVYEMVLDNDGVDFKTTKEKVKLLSLKAKVTREQNSDDSDSQGESDEEEVEAFNLLARNFRKFFRKSNRFGRGNRFGNGGNRFGKSRDNNFGNKGGEGSKPKGACFEDGDEQPNDATCPMAIDSQEVVSRPSSSNINLNYTDLQKENEELLKFNKDFAKTFENLLKEKRSLEKENSKLSSKINDLEIEVEKLVNNKEVIEPYQKCVELTQKVDSLKCNVSKLQNEALNFSKFKESSIALDDMISRQKMSQDKEGLGFSKNDKTTSMSPNKPIVFVKKSQKENSSTSFVKSNVPQSPFVNTRGSQAPIKRVQTNHQGYYSNSHNELRYTLPRVEPRPLLPTPHMRPSNSYVCLKCDLLPDDWIVDSGFTKHMTGNRRLFTSYKEYDDGHVVFGNNLKGKVDDGGNISHDSITIKNVEHVSGLAFNLISVGQLCDDNYLVSFTKKDCAVSKNNKTLAKGHRSNGLYARKLGDNSKQQICLASVVDNSTLWHRMLGHANMRKS
ncbi:hypothetical protein Tco_0913537, partial [Tanacetum coccineum]